MIIKYEFLNGEKVEVEISNDLGNTILHSDQGVQYSCKDYNKLTSSYNIVPSMSRPGTPIDNSPSENFFSILKSECLC